MMRRFLVAVAVLLWASVGVTTLSARAQNPGVVTVENPAVFDRIVAVSDVHGMYTPLLTLLRAGKIIDAKTHWTGKKTLLVVVGDSIDKGPKSIEVLRLWMRLQTEADKQGGRVVVLLGNHEAEFLHDPDGPKAELIRAEARAKALPLSDLTDDTKPLGHFLRSLPLAARVGAWVFCHAGWLPDQLWPAFVARAKAVLGHGDYGDPLLIADDSILEKKTAADGKKWWRESGEVRELERRLDKDHLSGVVFGHQPTAFETPNDVAEWGDGRLIKIDSGIAPPNSFPGHLLVFPHPAELLPQSTGGVIRVHPLSLTPDGGGKPIRLSPPA